MKKCLFLLTLFAIIGGSALSAGATSFEYTVTDNGSDNYTMTFDVSNDTLTSDIEWFSVFFGETADGFNFNNSDQFSNFSPNDWGVGAESQPTDWFVYSFEPTAIDIPGQFNADADFGGIAPGDTLGGFTVSFDWTGVGTLDDLFFEVGSLDVATWSYEWLADGYGVNTSNGDPTAPVPEPATILLMGLGLSGLGLIKKRKKASV